MKVEIRRAFNGWIVSKGIHEHVFRSWEEVEAFVRRCFEQ